MGLAKVHPEFRTPWLITLGVTVICALVAGFTGVGILEEMVNIGTLTAFILVSIAVVVLRHKRPDLKRAFKVPGSPVVPILAALICTYLTLNLSLETWLRFLIWLVIGLVIYASWGYRNARIATGMAISPDIAAAMEAGHPPMEGEWPVRPS
jgi:basic amino acid/polyamine antiporter, APA family